MSEKRPTIRDVAKVLGVSHTTVSLALRNDPSIPVRTRRRVQAAARKAGYHGNVLVSALLAQVRKGRLREGGEVVAVLTAEEIEGWEALPSVRLGMRAGRERAAELGLRLEPIFIGATGEHMDRVGRVLEHRGYRGLLLPPLPTSLGPLAVAWDRFAVVALGYSFSQVELHRVANAHFNGMVTCYRRLRDKGRGRIGMILKKDDEDRSRHYWLSGYLGARQIYGGAKLRPWLTGDSMSRPEFYRWLDRERPDAIIGMSREVLPGWLVDRGGEVPGMLDYACLDLLPGGKEGMAGIRQRWGEIYSTGVELLAGQLSRNEVGLPAVPKVTLIDGEWCAGAR